MAVHTHPKGRKRKGAKRKGRKAFPGKPKNARHRKPA